MARDDVSDGVEVAVDMEQEVASKYNDEKAQWDLYAIPMLIYKQVTNGMCGGDFRVRLLFTLHEGFILLQDIYFAHTPIHFHRIELNVCTVRCSNDTEGQL